MYSLEGYTFHCINRENKMEGGVGMYIKSDLYHEKVEILSASDKICMEEITFVITLNNNNKIYVSSIYRPPDSDKTKFVEEIEMFLLYCKTKTIFICGDYNLNLLSYENSNEVSSFLNNLYT